MHTVNNSIHHKGEKAPGGYYRWQKFLINFSLIYRDISKYTEEEQLNIKGRFNEENYKANKLKWSTVESHQLFLEVNNDKFIWDVPWMEDTYLDDDSSDDDAESEEESEEEEETKDSTKDEVEEFKEKMQKQVKFNRLNSLKPFSELEKYTLQLNDMKDEFKKKLHQIENGENPPIQLSSYMPITRWTMNANEFLRYGSKAPKKPLDQAPIEPIEKTRKKHSKLKYEANEEVFDWYAPATMKESSYFCISNIDRRTLKAGEQAFNSYGNCSNRYLLQTYGFAYENNNYDNLTVYLQMKADATTCNAEQTISLIPPAPFDKSTHVQIARLKVNQINLVVVQYLRKICRQKHFGENDAITVLLTRPIDLNYELFVF